MGIHMTLREDIERKLQTCAQTLSGIATHLYTSHDLANAAREAETFKKDTLMLISSVIDQRRTELAQTMNLKELEKLAPEDVLLQRVIVTKPFVSILQTAMHRAPNFAETSRIIEPMACAQQLLQTALRQLPPDEGGLDTMDSTDVIVVE